VFLEADWIVHAWMSPVETVPPFPGIASTHISKTMLQVGFGPAMIVSVRPYWQAADSGVVVKHTGQQGEPPLRAGPVHHQILAG
jgi:hypothetical protein